MPRNVLGLQLKQCFHKKTSSITLKNIFQAYGAFTTGDYIDVQVLNCPEFNPFL